MMPGGISSKFEINHLVTTDNHGTLTFVERVDNALEYVSIDVQIITIQLDGESSAMFAHDGMCPASPDSKVGARGMMWIICECFWAIFLTIAVVSSVE